MYVHYGNLHIMTHLEVTWQGQRSFEVKLLELFQLTFFKLLLFEQVRFNYNQTWYIGALWEPSHYDALRGYMTRSKVIWGQIVTVIWRQIVIVMVALFQIAPAWTGSLRLQPNLVHRCTMGTFSLWRSSRLHDKVKGHWRSNCYSYLTSNCYSYGCPFSNCSCMNRLAPITTKLES